MPRQRTRYIHVESKNALLELLYSGADFIKIFVANHAFRDPKTKKIIEAARQRGIPVERINRRRLDRLARTSTCEGLIGLKPAPKEVPLKEILRQIRETRKRIFVLLLNDVSYMQNIGALLRTAFASGVDVVIIPKRKDSHLTEDVTRISKGASERVPIVQMNLFQAITMLKDEGVSIIGVHMEGTPYHEADLRGDVALVLGNEEIGISARILPRCDSVVSIPMEEGLDSLNVAAAGAIVMFEKKRQDSQK
ncbi:MAG: 23S rRNA (guanosine(2251)-2'-O)-methyltransferase RlmB [Candidatus Dojkabacteria bacterium]|nr:23S rRNA (guanosine(2251)-2'-O)-methyltransferase RlmB [Candidatus Dojkabacteria bacterium]